MHQEPSPPFPDPVASARPQAGLGVLLWDLASQTLQVSDVCSLLRTRAVSWLPSERQRSDASPLIWVT